MFIFYMDQRLDSFKNMYIKLYIIFGNDFVLLDYPPLNTFALVNLCTDVLLKFPHLFIYNIIHLYPTFFIHNF